MTYREKDITVDVPVATAYGHWNDFENFPTFMIGVKSVTQLGDGRLLWVAEIGGKDVEWTALVTQQEPNQVIGWRSTSGAPNQGSVTFEPLAAHRTRVTVRIEYTPAGVLEKTGSALGLVTHRIEADLERFKEFVEQSGAGVAARPGLAVRTAAPSRAIEPEGQPGTHGA